MIRSLMLLISLWILAGPSCSSVEIPDIAPEITLPASGDCYSMTTLSHKVTRYTKDICVERSKRAIKIYSEDWQKLKIVLLKNCITNRCKQSVGALDDLFKSLDNALVKVVR